jgi:hypothetical protein
MVRKWGENGNYVDWAKHENEMVGGEKIQAFWSTLSKNYNFWHVSFQV